jgi:hypothetical protein
MVASFANVVVYPTQDMLRPPWTLFRGGPDWPWFWLRRDERHCRYRSRIPLDVRPRRGSREPMRDEPKGTWCGPVSQHFGHAIANFGSRIAEASVLPRDRPLVFSARPGEVPPDFLWQMLRHYGVDRERVRIVSEPTRFASLLVAPQAEPLHGPPPSARHLELLDRLAGPAPPPDGSRLYVSRAMLWKGKIAGDAFIERALLESGHVPFHPELVPLSEQLDAYRRASSLVFAEGSAIHALQLLGRVAADVVVVCRRRGSRLAETPIRARAHSLSYVDAVAGTLVGLDRRGRRQPSTGMTVLDDDRLVMGLERAGVPIGATWSRDAFAEQREADVARWVDARLAHPLHPGERGAIRRSLRGLGPTTWRRV